MKTYTIYKLTSPSKKVYIGQTVSITNRFSCYKNLLCEAQTLLYRSLIKYGISNKRANIPASKGGRVVKKTDRMEERTMPI